MPDLKQRLIEGASSQPRIARKLAYIERLERSAMGGVELGPAVGVTLSAGANPRFDDAAQRIAALCDDLAATIARPGEDRGELSDAISFAAAPAWREVRGLIAFRRLFFAVVGWVLGVAGLIIVARASKPETQALGWALMVASAGVMLQRLRWPR